MSETTLSGVDDLRADLKAAERRAEEADLRRVITAVECEALRTQAAHLTAQNAELLQTVARQHESLRQAEQQTVLLERE